MNKEIPNRVRSILDTFDPDSPILTADSLRKFWMTFEPKSIGGIKAELGEQQETLAIPVPVLKSIRKELSKSAKKNVSDYIPLTCLLRDEYGREGRVVAVIAPGAMELVELSRIVILLKELCRTCITWEDADRLAMDALEPIVRKEPEDWVGVIEPWLENENKWIRRAWWPARREFAVSWVGSHNILSCSKSSPARGSGIGHTPMVSLMSSRYPAARTVKRPYKIRLYLAANPTML